MTPWRPNIYQVKVLNTYQEILLICTVTHEPNRWRLDKVRPEKPEPFWGQTGRFCLSSDGWKRSFISTTKVRNALPDRKSTFKISKRGQRDGSVVKGEYCRGLRLGPSHPTAVPGIWHPLASMGTYRHACGTCKTHAGVYNERVLSLSLSYTYKLKIFLRKFVMGLVRWFWR